jgi:ABC-type sulfate/molybdate transport systems ATPase subunit
MSKLSVNLEKELSDFTLRVKFSVESEQTLAIVGPSGTGKSVLLQLLQGGITPDKGDLRLGDRVLYSSEQSLDIPSFKRDIGLLFQDFALFPHLTVEQNVGYGLIGRMSSDECCEKVASYLKRFSIQSVAKRYPAAISGGEAQRVAMARTMITGPSLLLLDEPVSALDNELQQQFFDLLLEVRGEYRIPVILVTHDLYHVMRVSDQLLILKRGEILQQGGWLDLYQSPVSPAVAKLLAPIGRYREGERR